MKRILVVEDDVNVNRMYETLLPRCLPSCDIETVSNGQQAVDKFKVKDYDLIITDMSMPVMGGQELYLKVRDAAIAESRREPAFIFCTGVTECLNVLKGFQGTTKYVLLSKPFRISELVDAAVSLLDIASTPSASADQR